MTKKSNCALVTKTKYICLMFHHSALSKYVKLPRKTPVVKKYPKYPRNTLKTPQRG